MNNPTTISCDSDNMCYVALPRSHDQAKKIISFREIDVRDARMILDWRTSPRITQYMITDIPYDVSAQEKWIMGLYDRIDYYGWIFLCDDIPIGCIFIQNFDFENARTSWGFYKGCTGFPGVGSKVLPFFYNWLFFKVGIKEILTEVFHDNAKSMELYLNYGHRLMPDKNRVVCKNGREILLVALSLSVRDWDREKYKDSIAPFSTCRWKHSPV